MKRLPNTSKEGFTLIELLIAITIVAILSVIGFSIFQNIQRGSRDSVRRIEVDAIAKNIEATYDPQLRHYSYTVQQYTDDYHSVFPRDPLTGTTDAREYCTETATAISGLTTAPLTNWGANADCNSGAAWAPFNDKSVPNNAVNLGAHHAPCTAANLLAGSVECTNINNVQAYQICAKLEATTNVYCKESLQQ